MLTYLPVHFRSIAAYFIDSNIPFDAPINHQSLRAFRSLSQSCRRLRNFALPLVWARVEVRTVKRLGQLRELLAHHPSIAPLIKGFRFMWDMKGECSFLKTKFFPKTLGSMLDLAFQDRLQLWESCIKAQQDVEWSRDTISFGAIRCDRVLYFPPGSHDQSAVDAARAQGISPADYDWQSGTGARGPDGTGEDSRIKNVEQFTQCIIDVVLSLPSLQMFGWECPITSMPAEVFNALTQLKTLTDLRLVSPSYRSHLADCEYC